MKLVEPVFELEPTKHEVDSLGTRLQMQRIISHYRLYINIVRIWLYACVYSGDRCRLTFMALINHL